MFGDSHPLPERRLLVTREIREVGHCPLNDSRRKAFDTHTAICLRSNMAEKAPLANLSLVVLSAVVLNSAVVPRINGASPPKPPDLYQGYTTTLHIFSAPVLLYSTGYQNNDFYSISENMRFYIDAQDRSGIPPTIHCHRESVGGNRPVLPAQ